MSWITGIFGSIIGGLAKWAATITGFAAGAYWRENRARKKNLDIAKKQLEIANKSKLRRDELLERWGKRKR